MRLRRCFLLVVIVFIAGNMLLAACGDSPKPSTTTVAPTATVPPTTTAAPATTATVITSTAATTSVTIALPTPTTQPRTIAPLGTSTQAGTQPAGAVYLYYFKDDSLWSAKPDGTNLRKIVDKVYSYTRVGFNQLVVFQQVNDVLQLKLIKLSGGLANGETLLDNKTFSISPTASQNNYPSSKFNVDVRAAGKIAVSPDGTQVAYTKTNFTAAPIPGTGLDKELPTELWVANLNATNPTARVLVANGKDYISYPQWSPDGNRVLFIRTPYFGTGAGYPSALWSVYKDGSRLSFLTGPDLGTISGIKYSALPAANLRWISPTLVAFQSYHELSFIQWVHDLTTGSDFPRPIAIDVFSTESKFCDSARRFVYIKQGADFDIGDGLYSVESDNPPANGLLPTATLLDTNGVNVYDCVAGNILYTDKQGQLTLQKLASDGKATGAKISLGNPIDPKKNRIKASFSPDGKLVVVYSDDKTVFPNVIYLYREDGSAVGLSGSAGGINPYIVEWLSEKTLAVIGSDSSNTSRLLIVDLNSGVPAIKPVDSSNNSLDIVLPSTEQHRYS